MVQESAPALHSGSNKYTSTNTLILITHPNLYTNYGTVMEGVRGFTVRGACRVSCSGFRVYA